jgi:uncharacterized protein with beta-barrel porin domain
VASATGLLGNTLVTDTRGTTVEWSASAASTTFTTAGGPASTGVGYTAGAMTVTGDTTIASGTVTALTTDAAKVAGPTAITGNNTAQWNPTLAVALPANALAGDYAGTVTTSVL